MPSAYVQEAQESKDADEDSCDEGKKDIDEGNDEDDNEDEDTNDSHAHKEEHEATNGVGTSFGEKRSSNENTMVVAGIADAFREKLNALFSSRTSIPRLKAGYRLPASPCDSNEDSHDEDDSISSNGDLANPVIASLLCI